MALIALIIGAVLIVAAIRGTHGDLMAAIRTDVPAFAIWAAAIFGVAVIGFVPGLKPVSRGLLALLIVAIVLANWRKLIGAFQGVAYGSEAQAAAGGTMGATGGGGGFSAASAGDFLGQLMKTVASGESGDYSDFFGGSSVNTGNSAQLAAATAADDAAFKDAQRSAQRAPTEVSEYVVGGANPVSAAVSSVVAAVGGFLGDLTGGLSLSRGGPELVATAPTAQDPLGTAGARQWQKDSFAFEAANLAALVASGQVDKSSDAYRSQLDYLANLTGGVATRDAEMAKLKALGL